ncbi:unnamed protein product [Sphenostylis stenocarpa]|uniref:Uncharacterized protein n=1 Tax=Sphenostylis stenocarpa TaxID=92480 RepID=A0AA86W0A6_9FABA|nr:unnamed protein product [Sphenostylis stenocarpa]
MPVGDMGASSQVRKIMQRSRSLTDTQSDAYVRTRRDNARTHPPDPNPNLRSSISHTQPPMLRDETVGSRSARHSIAAATVSNKVLVAIKAEKVISNTALAWALTHVVHSSDSITLLAVHSAHKTGRRFWNFSRLAGDCTTGPAGMLPERISDISESCAQMVLQLHNQVEVRVKIKVVTGSPSGAVAAEARWSGSHWVILDK